jgi:hypothetical protein
MALNLQDAPEETVGVPSAVEPNKGDMRAAALGQQKASPSLKDALRKKFEELPKKTRHGDFDVPGYDGMLVARYRRMQTTEVVALGEHIPTPVANDTTSLAQASVYLNADFLAAACLELFGRGEDGKLHSLGDGFSMRYDNEFAKMMGYEVSGEEGAREVVLRTFDYNELALKRHADEVDEWMTSLSVHTEEDSLGK